MSSTEKDPFFQSGNPEKKGHLRVIWWVLVGLIFLVGFTVRFYDLRDPPLDFHPTRQLHSALIARGMYYQSHVDLPQWQREMAVSQWRMEGEIEPQVFERLTAWIYGLVGTDDLRVPRLIAIFSWAAGAGFLSWLAVNLVGWSGALAAAWFFFLWPYGVFASRSFQPEPVLIMLVTMALWAAVHWEKQRGWKWAVAAGLLAGCAIYVKVIAAFFIGPAFLVLAVSREGRRFFRSPQVWVIAGLALLPYAVYHVDGVYIRGTLSSQFALRFFPEMWVDPAFYLRWISNLGRVLPMEMVLAAFLGAFLLRRPVDRALLLSQWIGYWIYGMTLPHHISTHDYYHLLLFPALALGLAGLASLVISNLRGSGWFIRAVSVGALLAVIVFNGYEARTVLKRFDAEKQARIWKEIGDSLGPNASVAALVPDYGGGLKYWGWINPSIWPTADDITWRESIGQQVDFTAWFDEQVAGKNYFVVTMLDDLDQQPELKSHLFSKYGIRVQTPDYFIFDLSWQKGN